MNQALAPASSGVMKFPEAIEKALIGGDLKLLGPADRVLYYNSLCTSLGLNPLTKPFAYIELQGKMTLYALKDCTEQIRNIRKVSITDLTGKLDGDIYTVTAKGTDSTGRCDAATGAVDVKGASGEKKANLYMKAETKAKRRLTLSLCGLGMLDESEVDSIAGARIIRDAEVTPTRTTENLPEAKVDAKAQAQAGQEDQRPVQEQQQASAPASAPVDDKKAQYQKFLEAFDEQSKSVKTRAELGELWENFVSLVKQDAEFQSQGWLIRKRESQRIGSGAS